MNPRWTQTLNTWSKSDIFNLGTGVGIASVKKDIDNYSDITIDIRGKKCKVLVANRSFLNNTSLRK